MPKSSSQLLICAGAVSGTSQIASLPVDARTPWRYSPAMNAGDLRLMWWKLVLETVRELFSRPTNVRYTSVPLWKPWRDF